MTRSLAALLALCAPAGALAQGAPAAVSPSAPNQAFLEAASQGMADSVVKFFPREGTWTWTKTYLNHGHRQVGWRFGAADTRSALRQGGPACDLFEQPSGHGGPFEGASLWMQTMMHGTRWRRLPGNRFVPPGQFARSPIYVQWRREGGAWVISDLGVEGRYWTPRPRLLGRPVTSASFDTAAASAYAFAPERPWFQNNQPINFGDWRYIQYGRPRALAPAEVTRVGELEGVAIYAEAGSEAPEVIYLAVGPGEYQPYERPVSRPCNDP